VQNPPARPEPPLMPRPSPRIGVIVPSINVVAEDDRVALARAVPQAPPAAASRGGAA